MDVKLGLFQRETWLRVLGNRVLRKIFGNKCDEVARGGGGGMDYILKSCMICTHLQMFGCSTQEE